MIAENESLAQRYSVVLEELRLEALKQIQQYPVYQQHKGPHEDLILQPGTFPQQNSVQMSPDQNGYSHAGDVFSDGNIFGEDPNATTPNSLMAELTSWGEFDSLVSPLIMRKIELQLIPNQGDSRNRRVGFYVHGRSKPESVDWNRIWAAVSVLVHPGSMNDYTITLCWSRATWYS